MKSIIEKQRETAERIVAYGRENGVQQHLIDAAVKFAYFESKLGVKLKNKNALGIFQYMPQRWKERHEKLLGSDRMSPKNQIVAMFRDLHAYEKRYNDLSNPAIPRESVTLEQYLYIKHHDGTNSEEFLPGLNRFREPNGLMVYHRDNPGYDATLYVKPLKTSTAPIRNPWEITFGLPAGGMGNGFELPVALTFPPYELSVTAYGPPTPAGRVWSTQSLPWPGGDNPWRTPEPHWASERRSYLDTHHYDPNGASVSTRHRFRRSVGEMTEAMASAAPPVALGAGASDPATSISRHAPLLTVQA
ncbi:hypothetical protein PV762_02200 [Mitsuaria sp. CC2]|uniref:hypothetical protein n=1 Tax=Mitsuaria sp. CC2 TaxID=3029186 RepID=UPI003B8AB0BF